MMIKEEKQSHQTYLKDSLLSFWNEFWLHVSEKSFDRALSNEVRTGLMDWIEEVDSSLLLSGTNLVGADLAPSSSQSVSSVTLEPELFTPKLRRELLWKIERKIVYFCTSKVKGRQLQK